MLASVLVALGAALLLAAVGRRAATALGQPGVLGEVVAGITFGALAGALFPHVRETLFPLDSKQFLALVGSVGVSGYLVAVGHDFSTRRLPISRTRVLRVAIPAAAVSIGAGMAAALALTTYKPDDTPGGAFALFVGVAVCVTALPVLARILDERGLLSEPLAGIALACAWVADAIAGLLLTASVVWTSQGSAVRLVIAVVALMILALGRSRFRVVVRTVDGLRDPLRGAMFPVLVSIFTLIIVGLAKLGVPFIVPAFLIGSQLGRTRTAAQLGRLGRSLATVGLPVFFVYTGVRTSFTDVSALTLVLLAAGVTVLAVGAKTAGALLGAWRAGLGASEGGALALLLNTRGVTELFILNVGLDAHLINPALFSAFVVMAVVTTIVTGTTLGRIKLPEPRVRTTAIPVAGGGLGYQRVPR